MLSLGLGVDPRLTLRGRARAADRGLCSALAVPARELWSSLCTVGRIRSFQVIVLQVSERPSCKLPACTTPSHCSARLLGCLSRC